jgi:hypothetical protein
MPEDYETNAAGQNADHHSTKYRFEEAIGDLIDNSIDANSTIIDVWFGDQDLIAAGSPPQQGKHPFTYPQGLGFLYSKTSSYLIVSDNGSGMTSTEFKNAVIKGERRKYNEWELGHYGVGLKKSTMSQAYETTIFTKKNGETSIKRISSVHIQESGKDQLLTPSDFKGVKEWMKKTDGYIACLDLMKKKTSGTIILMEGLHKLEKSIGSPKVSDRTKYVSDLKKKIRSYIGVIYQRYIEGGHRILLTNGKHHIIPKILFKFGGTKVMKIDPFFKDFHDAGDNRWTLYKEIKGINTEIRVPGTVKRELPLPNTLYLIPVAKDAKLKSKSAAIDENLSKVRDGLDRVKLQGIYIYRNQRLIDFGGADTWKGLASTVPGNALGRWEIHLPPHKPTDLTNLDFTLDSTKTDSKIGTTTMESAKRIWAKKEQWHPRDQTRETFKKRMDKRKEKVKPYEMTCTDCGEVGHHNKLGIYCKMYIAPKPKPITNTPLDSSSKSPIVNTTKQPIFDSPPGQGKFRVASVRTGELIFVNGNEIEINIDHDGFMDLFRWVKSQ